MYEQSMPNPTRRCTVTRVLRGWDVKEEENSHVVRRVHCTDWHRVERAQNMFNLQIDELESSGWSAAPQESAPTR